MIPKVSVIVAVYKAETYLYRCLNSLVDQTLEDFEIVLVDDGSPDNSGVICDRFANQYPFIQVIHKRNGGVASARQCGIDHAQGEYTIHVDADDWVESTMLEELYQEAVRHDADMVICDYFEIKWKERYVKQQPASLTSDAVLRDVLSGKIQAYCWNKLIRRSCYQDYHIAFPLGLNFEDLFAVCTLCLHDIRVAYLGKAFYHYDRYINGNSLSQTPDRINVQSSMAFIAYIEKRLVPATAYHDELNSLKCKVKKVAWASGLYSKTEFMNLYQEINPLYTRYQETQSPTSRCILLCLAGHYRLAKMAFSLWRFIRKFLYR